MINLEEIRAEESLVKGAFEVMWGMPSVSEATPGEATVGHEYLSVHESS